MSFQTYSNNSPDKTVNDCAVNRIVLRRTISDLTTKHDVQKLTDDLTINVTPPAPLGVVNQLEILFIKDTLNSFSV